MKNRESRRASLRLQLARKKRKEDIQARFFGPDESFAWGRTSFESLSPVRRVWLVDQSSLRIAAVALSKDGPMEVAFVSEPSVGTLMVDERLFRDRFFQWLVDGDGLSVLFPKEQSWVSFDLHSSSPLKVAVVVAGVDKWGLTTPGDGKASWEWAFLSPELRQVACSVVLALHDVDSGLPDHVRRALSGLGLEIVEWTASRLVLDVEKAPRSQRSFEELERLLSLELPKMEVSRSKPV